MVVDLQFKIKGNPNYKRYLREHSYWYKLLNRDPASFSQFVEEVKDAYGLRPEDRIKKALDTIEIMQSLMSSLK